MPADPTSARPFRRLLPLTTRAVLALLAAGALIMAGAAQAAPAAQNPLNTIDAASSDVRSPGIKTEPASEGGTTLSAIHDGDFAVYKDYWVHDPKPHTLVLLSNTLTDWVQASPEALIAPRDDFWGEKGNAIGSAFALPDGNILISSCSCINEGYTGAPKPTNVSAIADGREPWKILKLAALPDAPVSRENVWYQGPNFGTAFYYDADTDTLFFYGGFHDYHIGMMRVRNFMHPEKWGCN